jgi:hypothetical protein
MVVLNTVVSAAALARDTRNILTNTRLQKAQIVFLSPCMLLELLAFSSLFESKLVQILRARTLHMTSQRSEQAQTHL